MKAHTKEFKEQIKKFGRQLDSQITYTLNNEEVVLGKEQLNAITPHYEGDILKSVMKQLDLDSNVDIPVGTEVNYKFGIKTRSGKNIYDNNSNAKYKGSPNIKEETINTGKKLIWNSSTSATWAMAVYIIKDVSNDVGKKVRFKANINASGSNIGQYYIGLCNEDGSNRLSKASSNISGTTIGFDIPEISGQQKYLCLALYVNTTGTLTQNDYVDFTNVILTIDNSDMTYEDFGEYEYLDYGNYIVYSTEKQEDTRSYKIVCYDKMLYAMKDYESLNVQYPITIKNYLSALCTKIGLILKDTNFVNYDKQITNELYLDSEGNSLNYTYRDVLDEIAGATASTICINEDDELEVRYIKEYKLPSGYSELDYLENSNEQYIDTGIIPTTDTKIDLDFMYLGNYYNGWNPVFGERGSTSATYYGLFVNGSSLYITPNYAGFDPGTGTGVIIETNKKYNLKNDKGQFYLDDELKTGMSTITHTLTTGDKNIYLFAMNQNGQLRRGTQVRIYRCKFYEGDTLIRDYIPTLRLSDNKVGLYDIVNNVFYTNQGTGNFTYGSIVNESIDLIDEEYLKDINVNFGEKYGPVNSIVFSRSAESDNIYKKDVDSITENGLTEIKIKDNQILNSNNRFDFIDGVFNQLNGFEYYSNDFSSTGIAYYDLCDRYNIRVDNNIYSCIMMNDELDVSQGLEEKVHLDIPEKSETDYKKADTTDRRINQAWLIVNKQESEIEGLVSKTSILDDGIYTKEQVDNLLIDTENGITNTFATTGGNNILRNTGLWFESDDENNPYEFWTGKVKKAKEENAVNMNALSLQNTTLSQQQNVSNGMYTISFKYKRKIATANASIIINGVGGSRLLNSDEIDKEAEAMFNIELNTQYIEISFICDVDDGFYIYDLMLNSGNIKLAYSQNQNETTTDTVNISKGITITSSNLDVKFKADADGIRTIDKSNNVLTQFTDTGMTTKQATIEGKSQIVGTIWQEVNEQTWITRL